MKGCALQARMLRMSASNACTWGVPLCRNVMTANCPRSSSLHSSVSGGLLPCLPLLLTALLRPRLCSCFSFLYLRACSEGARQCAVRCIGWIAPCGCCTDALKYRITFGTEDCGDNKAGHAWDGR